MPTQITGADFLAARTSALLADAPRCGKTGASVMAADKIGARSILIITTATNRFNFARDVREWQKVERTVGVVTGAANLPETDVVVLPWSLVANKTIVATLRSRRWDVLIVDEAHYAKNARALRTKGVFLHEGLAHAAARVWLLTGTPVPNSPADLWPALRTLENARLDADTARGWPNAALQSRFEYRYCTTQVRFIKGRRVEVIVGGKNEDELRQRLDGWWLRRTQADVGICPPIYSTLLLPPATIPRDALDFDETEVLAAAESDDTATLDMHLGRLRRLTGSIKAHAVAETLGEEFKCGLDAVVLMCWHVDTMQTLAKLLSRSLLRPPVLLHGAMVPRERQAAIEHFQAGSSDVFIGQMQAAGEAIDLSRACELIFVEPSFTPAHMSQAALRITNFGQKRTCRVRVAALTGSIDERVTKILLRKVESIQKVLQQRTAA